MGTPREKVGWGLIGPGRFASEFAEELVQSPRSRLVAVASRELAKADEFASRFGFETAYGSYEELFADPGVDLVYIVVPHVFHAEIAKAALAAGKAVLCEKPLTVDPATTKDLIAYAKEKGVFLMEAMKTGFLPAIQCAKDWIESGKIGEPRLARADFCFSGPTDPKDRLMNPELGGGAVLDVGIYPLYLTRLLLGEVSKISATGTLTSTGVEDSASIVTQHDSGSSAAMTCSFRTDDAMSAVIYGTEGSILLPDFHMARAAMRKEKNRTVETFTSKTGGMVGAEIEAVVDAILAGQTECEGHTHHDSLRLAELMHEVRIQLGSASSEPC